jgi:hypothetical protein
MLTCNERIVRHWRARDGRPIRRAHGVAPEFGIKKLPKLSP